MKLCKNCKYINHSRSLNPLCTHEIAVYAVSQVDGYESCHSCQTMRWPELECGPEGKLFEPDFFHSITMMFQRKTD